MKIKNFDQQFTCTYDHLYDHLYIWSSVSLVTISSDHKFWLSSDQWDQEFWPPYHLYNYIWSSVSMVSRLARWWTGVHPSSLLAKRAPLRFHQSPYFHTIAPAPYFITIVPYTINHTPSATPPYSPFSGCWLSVDKVQCTNWTEGALWG